MGTEPAELRREIERRREDLGQTIDAIGDRVSPGRIIERRRNRMVGGFRSLTDRLMGTMDQGTSAVGDAAGSVRDRVGPEALKDQTMGSPLGAGAVAFGIGFVIAAALPSTDTEQQAAGKAQDALEPAKQALTESVSNVAGTVKEGAAEAAQDVKATASGAASEVAATAKDQASATTDDARGSVSS